MCDASHINAQQLHRKQINTRNILYVMNKRITRSISPPPPPPQPSESHARVHTHIHTCSSTHIHTELIVISFKTRACWAKKEKNTGEGGGEARKKKKRRVSCFVVRRRWRHDTRISGYWKDGPASAQLIGLIAAPIYPGAVHNPIQDS